MAIQEHRGKPGTDPPLANKLLCEYRTEKMDSQETSKHQLRLVIMMPVFSDWEAAGALCRYIDQQLIHLDGIEAQLFLVDDGSPQPLKGWNSFAPSRITQIDALLLRRNLGHQRAIAIGLCVIQSDIACDAIVVMDADGEDRPEDVVRLVNSSREKPGHIILAERRKRPENLTFRTGYWCYRLLHRALTGVSVGAGNFSILPREALDTLVTMSELWNHYAGAIYRSKLCYERMPTNRGRRLGGRSHMNLVDLVVHGFSGIATFYDAAATRIVIGSILALLLLTLAFGAVVSIRVATNLAVPGWATYTVGLLLVLIVQIVFMALVLVFILITTRFTKTFVPERDYRVFVKRVETLWSKLR